MRIKATQHQIGPEALDADRVLAQRLQALVEIGQRGTRQQQQRKTIAETVRCLDAAGPALGRQSAHRGIEAHQTQLRLQELAAPLRRRVAHVPGLDPVIPDLDRQLLRGGVELQFQQQRQHARGAELELAEPERRLDQRHARQFALRDELALRVNHHPGPVPFQAGQLQLGLLKPDAGAGLDGIDPQLLDLQRQHVVGDGEHIDIGSSFTHPAIVGPAPTIRP